ncbi:MAG: S4 domain-containing protein [Candidatus Hodarchaeales archaeon]|jgi:phospholipid N-methyltransferase
MRLDEWLVKQGLMSSRSKANRFIRNKGVCVNTTQCTKPAYLVKKTDDISIDESRLAEYNEPLGYQKLAFFVNQANIPFNSDDRVLDLGPSAGGFSKYILEQNIETLHAVEISPKFEPFFRLLKGEFKNFSYYIGDIFPLITTLAEQQFTLVTIDLTIDPIFLLDHIIELSLLTSSNKLPARVLCIIKIENPHDVDIILQKYREKIEKSIPNLQKLIFLDSLPEKKEKAMYLEFWTHFKES